MEYRKKSTVEAKQVVQNDLAAIISWLGSAYQEHILFGDVLSMIRVQTSDGSTTAPVGHWLVKDGASVSVLSGSEFEAQYEAVS